MKQNLLTFLTVGAIGLGGFAIAEAGHRGKGHGFRGKHGNHLEKMTENLDLTAEQKAKVQPILDQAKPQIVAIHKEAMQKTHAVMENATSQIRPLLTAPQQQKLDELKKAQEEMRNAAKKLHDLRND